jgi:hypothetical protein
MCQIIGNWGFYEEDSEFLLPWLETNASKFFEVLYYALVANSDWIHCRIEALWMVNNWMCNSAEVIGFFVAQETILDKILFSIPKYPNYQLCKESIPIIESFIDKCSDQQFLEFFGKEIHDQTRKTKIEAWIEALFEVIGDFESQKDQISI